MKIGKLLSVILLLFAVSGCTKEDRSDCILEDNATFMFVLKDQDGIDRFAQNIKMVDFVLFGEDGIMYSYNRLNESALSRFPGIKKTLPVGRYYAVCWGNVADNSHFTGLNTGITNWNDCFIEIPSTATRTGDPIYYAPYKRNPYSRSADMPEERYTGDYTLWEIIIPHGSNTVKEMNFIRAHRTVNVYIKGLTDILGNVEYLPTIEAQNVWGKYNFFYETQDYRVNFIQQTILKNIGNGTGLQEGEVQENEVPIASATFHGGFGEIFSDINLIVRKGSDGSIVHTVNLRQFLLNNPEEDKNDVNILISFLDDFGVTVTVPDWDAGMVTPGVN